MLSSCSFGPETCSCSNAGDGGRWKSYTRASRCSFLALLLGKRSCCCASLQLPGGVHSGVISLKTLFVAKIHIRVDRFLYTIRSVFILVMPKKYLPGNTLITKQMISYRSCCIRKAWVHVPWLVQINIKFVSFRSPQWIVSPHFWWKWYVSISSKND